MMQRDSKRLALFSLSLLSPGLLTEKGADKEERDSRKRKKSEPTTPAVVNVAGVAATDHRSMERETTFFSFTAAAIAVVVRARTRQLRFRAHRRRPSSHAPEARVHQETATNERINCCTSDSVTDGDRVPETKWLSTTCSSSSLASCREQRILRSWVTC